MVAAWHCPELGNKRSVMTVNISSKKTNELGERKQC